MVTTADKLEQHLMLPLAAAFRKPDRTAAESESFREMMIRRFGHYSPEELTTVADACVDRLSRYPSMKELQEVAGQVIVRPTAQNDRRFPHLKQAQQAFARFYYQTVLPRHERDGNDLSAPQNRKAAVNDLMAEYQAQHTEKLKAYQDRNGIVPFETLGAVMMQDGWFQARFKAAVAAVRTRRAAARANRPARHHNPHFAGTVPAEINQNQNGDQNR